LKKAEEKKKEAEKIL